jgi:1-deoxy-D-xylulose-5-phosphate reductoisomerase
MRYISPLPGNESFAPFPRGLAILGATGSIGTSALKVVEESANEFTVTALAGGRNADVLAGQAARHRPPLLAVLDRETATRLKDLLPQGYAPQILVGPEGYVELAARPETGMVLSAIVGAAGLAPTHAALEAGKPVALANKESLVLAGHLIRRTCQRTGAVILPVDSEHNALFQAVRAEEPGALRRLVLTASGGPFRGWNPADLETVTPEQALDHPNWSMGPKISIDSATLMNKGLEFIEACHLFGVGPDSVEVVVHPQSIVHSAALFHDTSLMAHLGPPDMRVAIAYCLAYPRRVPLTLDPVDLTALGSLTFEKPDLDAFPCLGLAAQALAAGPSHPVVLNAANEVAVAAFLDGRIGFMDIPRAIEDELSAHVPARVDDLESVLALDARVRNRVRARWA